jgi:hypothetical protein
MRYQSIKDFNKKSLKQQEPPAITRSPSPEQEKPSAVEVDLNKLIFSKTKDQRDILREIIFDYPETRKKVKLEQKETFEHNAFSRNHGISGPADSIVAQSFDLVASKCASRSQRQTINIESNLNSKKGSFVQ